MSSTPSNLGKLIDTRFELRNKRIAMQKEVDEIKRQERQLEDTIHETMNDIGTTKGGGKLATCSINPTTVSSVLDWDSVHKFVQETGYFHLLQRRISEPAFREMLEKDIQVPGVEPMTVNKLSITKASK